MRSYGTLSTAFYDLDKPAAPADATAYYLDRAGTGARTHVRVRQVPPSAPSGGSGDQGRGHVAADIGIRYAWRMTRDPGSDTVRWSGRYQRRDAGSVLAEESEEIVLRLYGTREVLNELHSAGFVNARIVEATDAMRWLGESGCRLYACETPAGIEP